MGGRPGPLLAPASSPAGGTTVGSVPTVEAVFRYPVKSMLGTRADQAELCAPGVLGDRGWALADRQTGKIASAKQSRLWRSLLQLRAEYHGTGDEVRIGPATKAV